MKWFHIIAFILLIIGGVNWGLVGLTGLNLVTLVFGEGLLTNSVYVLVGISTVYIVVTHKNICKICEHMTKAK